MKARFAPELKDCASASKSLWNAHDSAQGWTNIQERAATPKSAPTEYISPTALPFLAQPPKPGLGHELFRKGSNRLEDNKLTPEGMSIK